MKTNLAIDINDLKKSYKEVDALRGMSLQVPEGSLCGLVGLNGAGKTTTIRILLAMARADSGTAHALGLDALNAKENRLLRTRTAYIPERKELFPYMTAQDAIRFTASFYPSWSKDLEVKYARTFDLPLERNVTKLSKGTLTKLHMLLAIARGADLLILDEPTDGLDAVASEEALQALVTLVADRGTTILICSHRLEEIEQIADRLCLVHKGRCFKQGSLDEIRANTRRIRFVLEANSDQLAQLSQRGIVKQDGRSISILVDSGAEDTIQLAKSFQAFDIETYPVPLREMFVETVRRQDALA